MARAQIAFFDIKVLKYEYAFVHSESQSPDPDLWANQKINNIDYTHIPPPEGEKEGAAGETFELND